MDRSSSIWANPLPLFHFCFGNQWMIRPIDRAVGFDDRNSTLGRIAPLDVGCVKRQLAHQVPVERHNPNAVTGYSGKTRIRLWQIGHHLMLFPEQAQRGIQQCVMGLCSGFVCPPSKVEQYFLKAALACLDPQAQADFGCADRRTPHRAARSSAECRQGKRNPLPRRRQSDYS